MSDQLLVTVTPNRAQVEAGGFAEVTLQVQNHGGVVDEYVVEALGDAANWIVIERPQISIFPEGSDSVRVSIRPPRDSYPEAGIIPVGFRVRSTINPDLAVVEECLVELRPFVEIGCEIAPKTARGRFSASHRLRVLNKGNAPVRVAVRAEVQQGDCQFGLPQSPLLIGTGRRATTKIKVRPSNAFWRGNEEMHQYRVTLEPQGGAPVAIDAMMRQRPITRIPTAFLVALALVAGGAYVVSAKGPSNLQQAFHWNGPVDLLPGGSSSPTATNTSGQPTPTAQPTHAPTTSPTACSPAPPSAPTNVSAAGADGQAVVKWTPSVASACGPAITGYSVSASPGTQTVNVDSKTTTATITNLLNGTTYTFSVLAVTGTVKGPAATSSPITLNFCHQWLTQLTLTRVAGGLNWQGNAINCDPFGPYTGTVTITTTIEKCIWVPQGEPNCSTSTNTYRRAISGLSGTTANACSLPLCSASYTFYLQDAHGHSATASI